MNLVTRSARRATRHIAGDHSLASFKKVAHRANRAKVNRTLHEVCQGKLDPDDAEFMPKRSHLVTAWEID